MVTRISLLLHDVGKPFSYQQDGSARHYHEHPGKSASIARESLCRLNFDKDFIGYVCKIIEMHDTPLTESDISTGYTLALDIFEVQRCDALAHNPKFNAKRLDYLNKTELLLKSLQDNTL